ncbi:type II toxin-antitoxin system Phd/YefM family antitoxin [Anabaena sp. PCC 7108]|uniref:type II toxin-antitoxin system Phd/YefM family antitoxin n=1 Tax=Anabaena sp. PCC 7108 TaxID=163908 RepID=UPI00034D8249|nr:type II toxin-antitoxin system prevent-host-death family antitoxin [Anabaena sp. PCC 7108]
MQQITITQASQHLFDLIEAALNGEEIIITKDNQPAVKLIPVLTVKRRRQPGSAKGMVKMADDFDEPLEDFKDY